MLNIFPFLFIDYDAVVWIHLDVVHLVAIDAVFFWASHFGGGDYGLPLQAKAMALNGGSGTKEGWQGQ